MSTIEQVERYEKRIDLEKCFRLQRKLAALSHNVEDKRFGDLYNLTYWQPIVNTALHIVRTRRGAKTAGVDGKTKDNVNDRKLADEIRYELKSGSLRPSPLLEKRIPKDNGKTRTLSIPTYKDRVILTILKLILEPIYEPHFDASSHGFRPNHSTHDAISEIKSYLGEKCRYAWVVETDVKACFDRIHKGRLLSILEERIADGRIIQLIRRYLHAGMAMEGFPRKEEGDRDTGCPQGSALSPLLCNIYLDKLDKFVNERLHRIAAEREKGKKLDSKPASIRRRRAYLGSKMRENRTGPFHLIRYADDLVIVSPARREQVQQYFETVKRFTKDKLRLEFAEHKTRIVHAADGFNFLGFHLKRIFRSDLDKRIVLVTVDPKRKQKHREKIQKLLKGSHDREEGNVITALNQRIRGWRNYYQKSVTNCNDLDYIDQSAFWLLVKWLMKKFKAPISKIMKAYYRRMPTPDGRFPKTLAKGDKYLERAAKALPKHVFDYTRKQCHPWIRSKSSAEMLKQAFPMRPRAPSWSGTSGYGESYAKTMRKALERDNYRCNKCGEAQNLHVHHINKRNSFHNPKSRAANCLENLVTLCRDCHKYANKLSAIDCLNWLLAD